MKTVAIVALVLAIAVAAHADEFDDFTFKFSKVYSSAEEHAMRRTVFYNNLKTVARMNAEAKAAGHDQVYNVTIFMDLSPEEFAATHLNYNHKTDGDIAVADFSNVEPMTTINWREKGVITPVKNQGQCGSCWAFSATETIESFWALAGNPLTKLSPQQITSCTTTCYGCGGGWPYRAFEYVMQAGIESDSAYPYTSGGGSTGACDYKAADVVAHISGWKWAAQNGDESNLLRALSSEGPISVCVDASSWQFYSGGILSSNCGQQLDHCVQLTGYQSDYQGKPVWHVRNSWTAQWGEDGYITILEGENLCGIANAATYVTI